MVKKCKKAFKMLTSLSIAVVMLVITMAPVMAKEVRKAPTLTSTEETIVIGGSYNFNINNKVKGSTYKWTSSNPSVATVNERNGVVTGVYKGSANIHCRIFRPDGTTSRLIARVQIVKPAVNVEISNKITEMEVGDIFQPKLKITPVSSDDEIEWTSSDNSIAHPLRDGYFSAKAAGEVTITASAVHSGRSDSMTVKVYAEGEDIQEPEVPGEEDEGEELDINIIDTVLEEDFSKSLGGFIGRGDASVTHVTAGLDADGGSGLMRVSGRTNTWNGASLDIMDLVEPGATYYVTAMVRYTSGEDVETFMITQERESNDENKWVQAAQTEVEKGKWTELSGVMEIIPSTRESEIYFETGSEIDFMVDNFAIYQIDADEIEEEIPEIEEAEAGEIVYENDFEDGSLLDPRASSVRTNTTEYSRSGKSSVKVESDNAWDGAGVLFARDNGITKASLFGKTVHTELYVMYAEGPAEVEFKLNNMMNDTEESNTILSQVPVKKGEWTLLEGDAYIPENTEGNIIFLNTEGNDDLTFYIDDVKIQVVE